ncbi:MAG: sulfatase-like hydrolase/transferase, partial [Planctomycetaceae bacterium]
ALNGADDKTYTTDWLCDRAIDFINLNASKPFCYMVSLPDPHGPNTVRPPYDTMYANAQVPIPSTLRRRPEQIPKWGQPAGVTAAQLRKLMIQYYGMVKCIDDNVGQILDALRKQGLLERTIIVFTSDHGDLCGEHGRLNKGVPYEGSARIPFLMHAPGKIAPGTVVTQALTCIDFFPTVLSLMNVSHDLSVDGRDASGLLTGKSAQWDDIAFVRSTPRAFWLSAVTERYKLVFSSTDQPWLIDLKQDPNEINNLFGEKRHTALIRQLTAQLSAYAKQHRDPYADHPRIQSWMKQASALK